MRAFESLKRGSRQAPGDLRYVQVFVNTLDVESGRDDFADVAELERWLKTHTCLGEEVRVTRAERDRLVAVRESLRELLTRGRGTDAALVDVMAAAGRGSLHLARVGDRLELVPVGDDVDAAVLDILLVVQRAMADGSWDRLKVCAEDACRWAFYDSSRNRSGSWCSMEGCGNRAKVRAHRSRQRTADA